MAEQTLTLPEALALAQQHHNAGELPQAEQIYRQILQAEPNQPDALHLLGLLAQQVEQFELAIPLIRRSLEINPHNADAHCNLGNAFRAVGDLAEAVASCRSAIALEPQMAEAHNNLGNALRDLGDLDGALESFSTACQCQSKAGCGDFNMVKNLISALLYQPDLSHQALFDRCAGEMAACRPPHARHSLSKIDNECRSIPAKSPPEQDDSAGKIRIGYLSSDFYNHPVGQNIRPLLAHHDHSRFEIFCYAERPQGDEITEELRRHSDHWRDTHLMNDAQTANQIRQDGIQIMVYLAGFFDANRLMVATYRPAPVQVSFHNLTSTTLPEMDYWLTDELLHPTEDTYELFSEQLCRLPNFYIYPTLDQAPSVGPLPALKNGFITFASFNNPTKINNAVIRLWSHILKAVPGSRLLLKYRNHLANSALQERLIQGFTRHDIPAHRLELISARDQHRAHLDHYNRADIALDPFPFTGATTTFQALWMGVPVVTLKGERFIHRMAADIVTHGGFPELAVDSHLDYLAKAVQMTNNWQQLQIIRAELREKISASPLCDGLQYAKNIEALYATMKHKKAPPDPPTNTTT
ncbi:MAG: tetratricopeptide repeat protein [Magnetococcales bacterium]|nr:tetratricopeptide repeat protein [Magnetococcales bacterium]